MDWIHHYQLFLFDLDGLLVDTEKLHYQAYITLCAHYGITLHWDFDYYSQISRRSSQALRDQLNLEFPSLFVKESNWNKLYEEKTLILVQLLEEGKVTLMPGVEPLLNAIDQFSIPCCVVTHSLFSLVKLIKLKCPILDAIPYWITREDYIKPKPDAECYQLAIDRYGSGCQTIIGFEDSPRGLYALMKTRARPVLICPSHYSDIKDFIKQGISHYTSFEMIIQENTLLISANYG